MRGNLAAGSMLNRPEQQLYGRLVRAFPGHVILAHVALSRLLTADQAAAGGQANIQRHGHWAVDFVVCRSDFTAVAVLEIEQEGDARGARDQPRGKEQLLQAAGIKVLRVIAGDIPSEAALKALVAALPLNVSAAQLMRRAS